MPKRRGRRGELSERDGGGFVGQRKTQLQGAPDYEGLEDGWDIHISWNSHWLCGTATNRSLSSTLERQRETKGGPEVSSSNSSEDQEADF